MSVQDDSGEQLAPGPERGRSACAAGNVMQGYWNRPRSDCEALRADGSSPALSVIGTRTATISITDRKKDMLLVNGINVYPARNRRGDHQFPGVKEAAVVGVPDARRANYRGLCVSERRHPARRARLAPFHKRKTRGLQSAAQGDLPSRLPRNATGKVLKTKLREQVA